MQLAAHHLQQWLCHPQHELCPAHRRVAAGRPCLTPPSAEMQAFPARFRGPSCFACAFLGLHPKYRSLRLHAEIPAAQEHILGSRDELSAGALQPSWGQDLAGISALYMNNTNLTGTLPGAWAQNMTSLVHLDLTLNSFTGEVPAEWAAPGAFPELQTLFLGHTYLTGSLPGESHPNFLRRKQAGSLVH